MVESTKEVTTRIDNEEEEGTTISRERPLREWKGKVGLVGMRMQVRSCTGDPRLGLPPSHSSLSN